MTSGGFPSQTIVNKNDPLTSTPTTATLVYIGIEVWDGHQRKHRLWEDFKMKQGPYDLTLQMGPKRQLGQLHYAAFMQLFFCKRFRVDVQPGSARNHDSWLAASQDTSQGSNMGTGVIHDIVQTCSA